MDPDFDHIHFKDDKHSFKFFQGYDKFIDGLAQDFPEEREGISKYVESIKDVCNRFPFYRLNYFKTDYFLDELINKNAHDHINEFVKNNKLKNILAATSLLYGGVTEKTPFYVHALVLNSYIESSYRCIKGGSQIAIELSRVIHRYGGTVLKNKKVTDTEFDEEGKVKCIITADGEKYYGSHFISNIHPKQTIELFGKDRFKKVFVNRILDLENSISSFSLHLALKKESIPYQNHNIYQHNIDNVWGHEKYDPEKWPMSYLLSMSPHKKNQKWADSLSVLAYMRYDEVEQWAETYNTIDQASDRHTDYQNFKRKKENQIIEDLKQLFPDIESHIEGVYSSTPLTFRDYIGTDDGSMYGIQKDSKNPLKTLISNNTKIKNLYLTGQNINLHGVLGVTISAFLTSFNLVDREKIIANLNA